MMAVGWFFPSLKGWSVERVIGWMIGCARERRRDEGGRKMI